MDNQELQEKRQAEYKVYLDLKRDAERQLNQVREQTKRVIETRRAIERHRKEQLVQYHAKLKEAVKNKDYKAIAKSSKNIAKIEREVKSYKKLSLASYKVNSLTKQNKVLAQKINAKMEAMALREARARNIITKSMAKVQNVVDSGKLKVMNWKQDWKQYRLKNSIEKYNKKYQTSVNFKHKQLNKDLNIDRKNKTAETSKSKESEVKKDNTKQQSMTSPEAQQKREVNKDMLKDYNISKENNVTTYTNKNTGVQVQDNGNSLTAVAGKTNEEKVKGLIDVAKAKGWDLSKVQVNGSPEFRKEAEKQIKAELEKQKPKEQVKTKESEAKKENTQQQTPKDISKESQTYQNMYNDIARLQAENKQLKTENQELKARDPKTAETSKSKESEAKKENTQQQSQQKVNVNLQQVEQMRQREQENSKALQEQQKQKQQEKPKENSMGYQK